MRHTVRLAAGLLLLAAPASAQVEPGRFQVNVEGGIQQYAEKASLESGVMAGLRTTYFFNEHIGLGGFVLAGRPMTRGDDFPLVRYSFLSSDETNDTTLLYSVSQRTTHLQYGLDATYRFAFGRFAPFVSAGFGRYRIFLNPAQETTLKDLTGNAYQYGAGVEVDLGENSGVRLGLTDQVLLDYKRHEMCIACQGPSALMREYRFPNPTAESIEPVDALHNLRFMASFNFVPGGRR